DRGRGGAPSFDGPRIAERLAEMPALGMRSELEQRDDVARRQTNRPAHPRNVSLPLRILAKTSAGAPPGMPTAAATSGTSARRNGLAAFSAPIVTGSVGLPSARNLATSSARALSALLFGSMVSA